VKGRGPGLAAGDRGTEVGGIGPGGRNASATARSATARSAARRRGAGALATVVFVPVTRVVLAVGTVLGFVGALVSIPVALIAPAAVIAVAGTLSTGGLYVLLLRTGAGVTVVLLI